MGDQETGNFLFRGLSAVNEKQKETKVITTYAAVIKIKRVFGFIFPICAVFMSGCVPVTREMLGDAPVSQATKPSYEGLAPGSREQQTLHFLVEAYGQEKADAYGRIAEQDYERIMQDTGLYSFSPREPYRIVVYETKDEFHKKTGQPEWSGGVTVGNAILVFDSPDVEAVMAHEMTHVIYNEYMMRMPEEQRWINEGLAVYEEIRASSPERREIYYANAARIIKMNPMPFSQMVTLMPATERERLVNKWYVQVGNVVQFMVERGGRLGVSVFLSQLKNGASVNTALEQGFPSLWKDMQSLEKAWLMSLNM